MKRIHGLILALGLWGIMVPVWAEPALSVPAIPTEVSEVMPPSDMGTPVPLPSDEDLKKSLGQNSKVQESIPAPTATSVPEEPTPTPLKSLVSSPTPFATATEEPGGRESPH